MSGLMRYKDFVITLNVLFDLKDNRGLAGSIAEAMEHALDTGSGEFYTDGITYVVSQSWYDGCTNGDCNPATCWTKWTLT